MPVRPGKKKSSNETIVTAITDASERMTALVHDEIELAKAEVAEKVSSIGRGAAAVTVGAVFGYFALIFVLIAIALVIDGAFFTGTTFVWVGFAIVGAALLLLGGVSFLVAKKLFGVGAPVPDMAIDEAKKIKQTLSASTSLSGAHNQLPPGSPNGVGNGHAPVSAETIAAVAAATTVETPQSQTLPPESAQGAGSGGSET